MDEQPAVQVDASARGGRDLTPTDHVVVDARTIRFDVNVLSGKTSEVEYEIRYSRSPIQSEDDWNNLPALAGTLSVDALGPTGAVLETIVDKQPISIISLFSFF